MILTIDNDTKVLTSKSEPVKPEEVSAIVAQLEAELKITATGIGLSAIQIGISKQVAIIRLNHFKLNLYNPHILFELEPTTFKDEGCLSVPNTKITTDRYYRIVLQNGDKTLHELAGLPAIAVQHELDHMKGILITNREHKKENQNEKK